MELLDLVDENGVPTGEVKERELVHRDGDRHRTSHVWLFRQRNGRWQVLLQKRSEPAPLATKEITLPEYAEHEVGMIPQLAARFETAAQLPGCLLYTSPSPRD